MTALTFDLSEELVNALAERVRQAIGPAEPPRFLDLKGLADHYRVPERQIRMWRELGMPARKVGKRLMMDIEDVDRWLSERPVA